MENIQPHNWFFKQTFSKPDSVKTVLDILLQIYQKKLIYQQWKIEGLQKGLIKGQRKAILKLVKLKFRLERLK
jgi:hypothetical protein